MADRAGGSRPARVDLGRILKPHGLKGEIVVAGVRLSAEEFLAVGEVHAVTPDGARRALRVTAARPFQHNLLVRFAGVLDIDQARALQGQVLEVDRARLPAAGEGTVYLFQLLGLTVRTDAGEELGTVREVMQTGATPVLVVRQAAGEGGKGRERLLPMSREVLVRVDTEGGEITVHLLPGLD